MNILRRMHRAVILFGLSFLSVYDRWDTFCGYNRQFQRLHKEWRRAQPDSLAEKDAEKELNRVRAKLHRLGASLGMSDVATELPLRKGYRIVRNPPVPEWIQSKAQRLFA